MCPASVGVKLLEEQGKGMGQGQDADMLGTAAKQQAERAEEATANMRALIDAKEDKEATSVWKEEMDRKVQKIQNEVDAYADPIQLLHEEEDPSRWLAIRHAGRPWTVDSAYCTTCRRNYRDSTY